MTPELEAKLQGLEEQLAADPSSESLREEILFEYLGPGLAGEPRRIHHAVEYVRRSPSAKMIDSNGMDSLVSIIAFVSFCASLVWSCKLPP